VDSLLNMLVDSLCFPLLFALVGVGNADSIRGASASIGFQKGIICGPVEQTPLAIRVENQQH
jgi:hypothetical protein